MADGYIGFSQMRYLGAIKAHREAKMNQDQKDFLLWCYQEGIAFDVAVKAASVIDAQSSAKLKELENWKADAIERIAELERENTKLRKENKKYERELEKS